MIRDTNQTEKNRWSASSAAIVAIAFLAACTGQPITNRVQAGSTIFLPVGGSGALYLHGFGSELSKAHGDYDDQRGELVFYLSGPYDTQNGEPADPLLEYRLKTRFVTRVAPDVMSKVGAPGSYTTYGTEVLAVVDIPPSNAPQDPGPLVTTGSQAFRVIVRHKRRILPPDPPNQPPSYSAETSYFVYGPPPEIGYVTIIPGSGTPTPTEAFFQSMLVYGSDLELRLLETIPAPQVIVSLSSNAPGPGSTPAAAEIQVSYPSEKLEILSVAEYGRNGVKSIVSWSAVDTDTIRISLITPDSTVQNLGIGFRLLDPLEFGRAIYNPSTGASDFSVGPSTLWNHLGVTMTPPAQHPRIIGIE